MGGDAIARPRARSALVGTRCDRSFASESRANGDGIHAKEGRKEGRKGARVIEEERKEGRRTRGKGNFECCIEPKIEFSAADRDDTPLALPPRISRDLS